MHSYSHTSLNLFEQCPRAFEYKYIKGEPEAFSTIEQHLGHTVHTVLQRAYEEKSKGRPVDAAALKRCYDEAWKSPELARARVIKRGANALSYYLEGLSMLRSFHTRVYVHDESQSVQLENRFSITLKGESGQPYDYSGVVDRLSRQAFGLLRITDYKTGKSVSDPGEDLQLRSYALYVLGTNDVDQVELCYEDLRNGLTRRCGFTRQLVAVVAKSIVDKIGAIEATHSYPPRPTILCDWCGYNPACGMAPASRYRAGRRARDTFDDRDDDGDTCPHCGAELRERMGRNGPFIGCSRYPRCRYTRDEW